MGGTMSVSDAELCHKLVYWITIRTMNLNGQIFALSKDYVYDPHDHGSNKAGCCHFSRLV